LQRNSRRNHWHASWCWPSSSILKGVFLRLTCRKWNLLWHA
jgi:hypothetical protein